MVVPKDMNNFIADVIELFGFLLANEISDSPIVPKDTGHMRDTFTGTYVFTRTSEGSKLSYTTPFYTDYIINGTWKMQARPFVNWILNSKGEELLKQAFRITDRKYSNK